MLTNSRICSVIFPPAPFASRLSEVLTEVSGVRSSWLTIETNSLLAASASASRVMSR